MTTPPSVGASILAGNGAVRPDPAREILDNMRLLRSKEAAAFLGVTNAALAIMRSRGRGPTYIRLPGLRAIRYRLSDLCAYIRLGRCTSSSESED